MSSQNKSQNKGQNGSQCQDQLDFSLLHHDPLPIDQIHDNPYDPETGRRLAVVGLIQCDNKYLLAKRRPSAKSTYGKWEFPGGKVEPSESDRQALIREIDEEFSVTIHVQKYLTTSYTHSGYIINLYQAHLGSRQPRPQLQLNAHTDYVWLSRVSDALDYDLTPATRDLAITTILKRIESS